MRKSFLSTAVLALVGGVLLIPTTASAQDEFNCSDFTYQEEAQAKFNEDPSDPHGLDGPIGEESSGTPGVACEDLPSQGAPDPEEEPAPEPAPEPELAPAPDPAPQPAPQPQAETPIQDDPEVTCSSDNPPPVEECFGPDSDQNDDGVADINEAPADSGGEDNVVPDTSAGVDTGGW